MFFSFLRYFFVYVLLILCDIDAIHFFLLLSNTALAYFNECCGKYGWNFGPFKMQVVLFPGGIEFMKIVLQLTVVAMQMIVKGAECIDPGR